MLRFFRNIRQKLLENGNIRKYFWYATGEILLVMIGILLALQVNNWNERRVESNLKADLIANYAKDLESNAAYIQRRKLNMESDLEVINQITARLKSGPVSDDTLKKIALIEFSPLYYAVSDINNDTYTSLISNNQLRLIPDELSAKMVDINFRMVDLVSTQTNVGEFFRYNLATYSFNYPMPGDQSLYSYSENEKIWDALDHNEWRNAFNGLMFTKKAGYDSMLPRIDSIQVRIDDVLNIIYSDYLKSK